jgi:hypothetical protein
MKSSHSIRPILKLICMRGVTPTIAVATLGLVVASTLPASAAPVAKRDFTLAITPAKIDLAPGQSTSATANVVWAKAVGAKPVYRLSHTVKGAKVSLQQGSTTGVTIMIVTKATTPVQKKSLTVTARSGGKTRKFTARVLISAQPNSSGSPAAQQTAPPTNAPVPPAEPTVPATVPTTISTTSPTVPTTVGTTTSTTTTTTAPTGPTIKLKKVEVGSKIPREVTGLISNLTATASGLSIQVRFAVANSVTTGPMNAQIEIGFGPTKTFDTWVFPSGSTVSLLKTKSNNGIVEHTIGGLKPGTAYSMIIRAFDGLNGTDTTVISFTTKRRVVRVTGSSLNLADDSDGFGTGELGFTLGANGNWFAGNAAINRDMGSGANWNNFLQVNVDYQDDGPLNLALYARDDDTSSIAAGPPPAYTPDNPTYAQRGVGEAQERPFNGDDSAMAFSEIGVLPADGAPEEMGGTLDLSSNRFPVKFSARLSYTITYV